MEENNITLGSLFDGIGGFPLCAELSGITPIWAAEIDPACVAVTHLRFPNMIHYGDVTQINGAEIPPVDIITFGSPCQDLSVAGKRKGIKHKEKGDEETTRSGLFVEAVRIIYEMREATNGQYPKYIVWENVPGAFSSQSGRDFQAVLEEITKADIPMPASGRWANAGVVRGSGICVAWRQLDAQYWGVPQRRKRIYLVGSFGDDSAAEILFKRDSVRRYLAPRRTERQDAPADTGTGVAGGDTEITVDFVRQSDRIRINAKTASTLQGLGGGARAKTGLYLLPSAGFHGQNSITAAGVELREETCPTLTAKKNADVVYAIDRATFNQGQNAKYNINITDSGISSTVTAKSPSAVCYAIGNGQANNSGLDEVAGALNCMHDQQAVMYGVDTYNQSLTGNKSKTLLSSHQDPDGIPCTIYKLIEWIVRRQTPLECERLQGYPDGWTVLPKITDMSDEDYELFKEAFLLDRQIRGKPVKRPPTKKQLIRWYNKLDCDGTRYRQLGNSLAIPCAYRVIGYIADYMREVVISCGMQ